MPTAAEAYAQNLAWRAMNDPGSLSSLEAPYAQQILSTQDAARESAKYQAAFSQPRDDTMVNSSSAYNALVQQYASSRNRVVSSSGSVYQGEAARAANPYQKDTAAYIAYEVGKTGGAVGIGVAQRALGQGVSPQDIYVAGEGAIGRINVRASDVLSGVAPIYSIESGRSTVQGDRRQQELTERAMRLVQENVLLSQGRLPERMLPIVPSALGVGTLYVPFGERTQQEIKDVSAVIYDPLGGAFGGYQMPKSIYEVEGGFQRKYAIQTFGGGTGALQSGMFSTKPLTADIRTQENFAKYAAGADIAAAEAIRASPERYSRLGAELYGGRVSLLATDLLTNKPLALADRPSVEMGRYAAPTGNLANLVDQFGVNRPKEELAVSQIPWQTATRGFSTVTREGVIAPTSKAELAKIGIQSGTLVKMQDRFKGAGPDVEFAGPAPFKSTAKPTVAEGDIVGGFVNWFTGGKTWAETEKTVVAGTKDMYVPGGLAGRTAFGEKSPEVVKGAAGSVVDYITGLAGWTPAKDAMQETDVRLTGFREKRATMEATATQEEYNKFLREEGFEKGILIVTPKGEFVENPNLTYDYGEFSKWGVGAGKTFRETIGITEEQLTVAQYNIEQKKGIETIPEKLVFGTGALVSTRPEKIISAYGAGAAFLFGGEVVAGASEAAGITAAAGRMALSYPRAAAVLSGAWRVGVPTAFAGLTYYGASEGLSATPERTTVNLGKMIPEVWGFTAGAGTAWVGAAAIERGYVGFQSRKATPEEGEILGVIDLSKDVSQAWRYPTKPTSVVERSLASIDPTLIREGVTPEYSPTPAASTLSSVRSWASQPRNLPPKTVAEIRRSAVGEEPYYPADFFKKVVSEEPTSALPEFAGRRFEGIAEDIRMSKMTEWEQTAAIDYNRLQAMGIKVDISGQPISSRTRSMREQQELQWPTDVLRPEPMGTLPMDVLPKTGTLGVGELKGSAAPNPFYDLARRMGVRVEPATPKGIGRSTERGVEFGGAPMSQQMLEMVTTVKPVKTPTTYKSAMDVVIGQMDIAARVKPAVTAAQAQKIVPSATTETFARPLVDMGKFEEILAGVIESEKRAPIPKIPDPISSGFEVSDIFVPTQFRQIEGGVVDTFGMRFDPRKTTVPFVEEAILSKKAQLVWMSPDLFIKEQLGTYKTAKTPADARKFFEGGIWEQKQKPIKEGIKQKSVFEAFALEYDERGIITGWQEYRNRAIAAKTSGTQLVPVWIVQTKRGTAPKILSDPSVITIQSRNIEPVQTIKKVQPADPWADVIITPYEFAPTRKTLTDAMQAQRMVQLPGQSSYIRRSITPVVTSADKTSQVVSPAVSKSIIQGTSPGTIAQQIQKAGQVNIGKVKPTTLPAEKTDSKMEKIWVTDMIRVPETVTERTTTPFVPPVFVPWVPVPEKPYRPYTPTTEPPWVPVPEEPLPTEPIPPGPEVPPPPPPPPPPFLWFPEGSPATGSGAKSDRRKLQLETAYIGPRSVRMIRPAGAPKLPWMKPPRAPAKAPAKKPAAKSRKKK